MVSESELEKEAKEIIKAGDAFTLTFNNIYEQLETKHGSLREHRKFLRRQVKKIVQEESLATENEPVKEEESIEDNDDVSKEPPKKKETKPKKEKKKTPEPSPEPSEEEKEDSENEEDPNEELVRQGVLTKEDLEAQRAILQTIQSGGRRNTRSGAAGAPAKTKKSPFKRSAPKTGDADETPSKKKKPTINKPLILSDALSEFFGGETKMTRPDVVKRITSYVKENNLQDPKNGRNILLDEKMQNVFKTKKTNYFKINALLSKHLYKPEEVA
ncbi:hypothetical protein PROFUN_13583 [Planoprotostelium fungivorum]|uniref:DM2 domain-containing protein n=1 Tax=Planoprotostelium fungivorum TaxID=1890364 RepID=A0A2P6N3K8_9EUKA|nr:hypothetical protein PROFUN_13583 [Planoprotostelium fungivorum]